MFRKLPKWCTYTPLPGYTPIHKHNKSAISTVLVLYREGPGGSLSRMITLCRIITKTSENFTSAATSTSNAVLKHQKSTSLYIRYAMEHNHGTQSNLKRPRTTTSCSQGHRPLGQRHGVRDIVPWDNVMSSGSSSTTCVEACWASHHLRYQDFLSAS